MSAETLVSSLERLASALSAQPFQQQFIDQWGWQGTPFGAADLALMSRQIAADIQRIEWTKPDNESTARFVELAAKVDKATNTIVPSLQGGYMSLDALMNTLVGIEILVRRLISKDVVLATLKTASTIGRRVQLANDQLDNALSRINGLDATTARILRAADAAEKLDLTTQELDEAIKHANYSKESVLKLQFTAEEAARAAGSASDVVKMLEGNAADIMKKIEAVYGASTTVALANSFDQKAKDLNKSVGLWVLVLLGGLLLGVLVGQERFPTLLNALENKPNWGVVAMYMLISALSLGPGVWLAWIATKQIGQRFRLAEDYGYKASLAKAYEGYRAEAANLDPIFKAQLFAVALGRLEELPLRTIDKDVSGSPLNDLLQSPQFKEHIEKLPGFKAVMIGLLERVLPIGVVEKWVGSGVETKTAPKE